MPAATPDTERMCPLSGLVHEFSGFYYCHNYQSSPKNLKPQNPVDGSCKMYLTLANLSKNPCNALCSVVDEGGACRNVVGLCGQVQRAAPLVVSTIGRQSRLQQHLHHWHHALLMGTGRGRFYFGFSVLKLKNT